MSQRTPCDVVTLCSNNITRTHMASSTQKRTIILTADTHGAEVALKALQKDAKKLSQEMTNLERTGQRGSQRWKELNKLLQENARAQKQFQQEVTRVDKTMKNLANASTRQLKEALSVLRKEIMRTSESSGKLPEIHRKMKAIQQQIDKNTNAVRKHGNAWTTAVKNMMSYVGVFQIFNTVKSKMTEIINLNLRLSDSLADIRKVSGMTTEEVRKLSGELAKIDTRNSVDDLNHLAYVGSKLGIGKYGVDGLKQFTEAAAQLNMALHEDMGDEAIGQLAKMAEVMGDMKDMGVAQSLLASGSAIFKLSASTTANGSNIMEFSKRLMGIGKTANLTTDEILALGSAADSMALMPEVAATAFNQFISTLQSKYGQIGKAVGIPEETLKNLLETGKTLDAIVMIFERMHSMGNLNALMPIMGDLGGEGARLANVLASMSENVSMLEDHIQTSKIAFAEATAITNEFNIQNETAAALMERASNIWQKMFMNTENVDVVHEMAAAWYEISKSLSENEVFLFEIRTLIDAIVLSIKGFISAVPLLITSLTVGGAIKYLPALWGALSTAFSYLSASFTAMLAPMTGAAAGLANQAREQVAAAQSAYINAKANYDLAASHAAITASLASLGIEETVAGTAAAELAVAEEALVAANAQLAQSTGVLAAMTGTNVAELSAEVVAETEAMATTEGLTIAEGELAIAEGAAAAATNSHVVALGQKVGVTNSVVAATGKWRLALTSLTLGALILTLVEIVNKMKALNSEEERTAEITDKIGNALATANAEYAQESKLMDNLFQRLINNYEIEDMRRELIDQINSRYGDYLENLLNESNSVDDITRSYWNATDALREYTFYRQKQALEGELVQDVEREGMAALIKLQGQNQSFGNVDMLSVQKAVDYYIGQGAKNDHEILDKVWYDFTGKGVPSNYHMDLSKIPLIGGFTGDIFESQDQKDYALLYKYVTTQVQAKNNQMLIDKNFPGSFTPFKHEFKYHDNTKTGKVTSGTTKKDKEVDPAANVLTDVKAMIDNIKNFYLRQKNAFLESIADDPEITEAMQNEVILGIEARLNEALASAKRAIVLGEEGWKDFLKTMPDDIREKEDELGFSQSKFLLANLKEADPSALRKLLQTFHTPDNPADNAALDRIWLSATGDEQRTQDAKLGQARERQKAMREDDYIAAVQYDYLTKSDQFGFFPLFPRERASLETGQNIADVFSERADTIISYFERARQRITDVITADVSTQEGKDALIGIITGNNPDAASNLTQMLGQNEDDWKLFYDTILKYYRDYTDAQKKIDDRIKKETDFQWETSGHAADYKNKERRLGFVEDGTLALMRAARGVEGNPYNDDEGNRIPRAGLMGGTAYMEQWSYDPELESYKAKLELAQRYYDFVMSHEHTARMAHEAELARYDAMNDYTKALIKQMKERVEAILELTTPIDTFGEKAGEAFALMTEDAEAGRDALKKATADMINDFLKQTVTMAQEYIKRRLLQKINDRLVSVQMKKQQMQEMASETAHQTTMTSIKESAGEVNVALEESVGAQVSAAKAANATTDTTIAAETAATEVTTEAGATTAKVGLGIASGAAKTIGSLGWWGIPLIAVISAVLSGLLGFAMSKVSSFLGGGSKATTDGPNAKLVSGMLTYDAGNVQTVLGTDGRLYRARPVDQLPTGIVSSPIATQVNGQPALVGERGPELVVGRETTAAIQMQEPELLQKILAYDRARSGTRQAFDAGNAQQVLTPATNTAALPDIAAFTAAVRAFQDTVAALQQNGIKAHINKFGRGGLVEEVKSGLDWDARHQ